MQSGSMCAKFEKEWREFLEETNSTAPNDITRKLLNRMDEAQQSLAKLISLIKTARPAIARHRARYNEVLYLNQRLAPETPDDDMGHILFPSDDNGEN